MNASKGRTSLTLIVGITIASCSDEEPKGSATVKAAQTAADAGARGGANAGEAGAATTGDVGSNVGGAGGGGAGGDTTTGSGGGTGVDTGGSPGAPTAELRTTLPLMESWRFIQDDNLSDEEALADQGQDWETVSLPHTWNADDAASLRAEGYERGRGFYRIEFDTPSAGARHWLEIGAASLVADLWMNGEKLGRHRGGFNQFRFDITDELASGGTNELLIKVDNSTPHDEDDVTAIDPFGGNFNVSGGLYRHVALISTPAAAHFALDDLGGPGVYATTTAVTNGTATINVRAKLGNHADEAGDLAVRVSLVDDAGRVAASAEAPVELESAKGGDAAQRAEVDQELSVPEAHLWQGRADPYLYQLVAELVGADGEPIDRVTQAFGIRMLRFDADEGFFLNGQHVRLRGVAMHQDFLGKAWATSEEETDTSLGLIAEMGANAIRLGHYPFSQYTLQRVSELGFVVWSEKASGLRTTVDDCTADPTQEYMTNARQQLQEMIRQNFNHPSVALWSVGNEAEMGQLNCSEPHDNVTPYLRELHELAKEEDPARATGIAELSEGGAAFGDVPFDMGGIIDVLGTNRYFLWYSEDFEELEPLLDTIHADFPEPPLGVTEYGSGAALTHHTDNVLGGPPEVRSARDGDVSFQPEEYQAYLHEENYRLLSSKPFLWGTFVWSMFDFGSNHRNEGDVLGVNTQGLVTFGRDTRKDAFFFYKANWSSAPTTYITGRRYTDRSYSLADVKVYSNADSVELSVNGAAFAMMNAADCEQRSCVFEDVPLRLGDNTLTAVGDHAGEPVTDTVEWSLASTDFNIAAGRIMAGLVSSQGTRFGSDNFFVGGEGVYIERGEDGRGGVPDDITGTDDPLLYKYFREGTFSYELPLADGSYEVTLGFLEPDEDMEVGERVFNVTANEVMLLQDLDVLSETGAPRDVFTRTFTVEVTGGRLVLDFAPTEGAALVSTIKVRPASATVAE